MSSAMSAAKAAGDHMRDWWFGTKPGQWVSMGVVSDGSYGIPKDVVFSFPVNIKDKKFEIVQGLEISDFARSKLDITAKELEEERAEAHQVLMP
ncbi:GSCOCG00007257001-RA-CDS [Cotesia congregata]|nr:GSCOCG00007257001-RA-CDS [Cotesia congregata]